MWMPIAEHNSRHRLSIAHLPSILAVARTKSFAKATAELGVTPSTISHAIRVAEQGLDAPLFSRKTRSVVLTGAGEILVSAAARALGEIGAAADRVQAAQGPVSGVLRINAPRVALQLGMTQILAEMTRRHPNLAAEVIATG
jgi:DNA-binding transcriptional LysR family regulator